MEALYIEWNFVITNCIIYSVPRGEPEISRKNNDDRVYSQLA